MRTHSRSFPQNTREGHNSHLAVEASSTSNLLVRPFDSTMLRKQPITTCPVGTWSHQACRADLHAANPGLKRPLLAISWRIAENRLGWFANPLGRLQIGSRYLA